jgi:hypothetical protein
MLGALNGVSSGAYIFRLAQASGNLTSSYSDLMISACTTISDSMKPVCGHPLHCKADNRSLYLGQSTFLLQPPLDPSKPFPAQLGGKNGVAAAAYDFQIKQLTSRSGQYSSLMRTICAQVGMKPICDHPSYCRTDTTALYIGQAGHLAYRPHRMNNNYVPSGFDKIRDVWNDLCSYTKNANGNYALCNIPSNSHSWRHPGQANPGFMCGKKSTGQSSGISQSSFSQSSFPDGFDSIEAISTGLCAYGSNTTALCNTPSHSISWRTAAQFNPGFLCAMPTGKPQETRLEGMNGVLSRTYTFTATMLATKSGSYSSLMRFGCSQFGMKPVCDHPAYCKTDPYALYIGQERHLSYPPHRNSAEYTPKGFAAVRDMWEKLCTYTQSANGNSALCNVPANSHAWKTPTQANPGFACGSGRAASSPVFQASLGSKHSVVAQSYEFKVTSLTSTTGSYSQNMLNECNKFGNPHSTFRR